MATNETRWIAEDGRTFLTQEQAEAWEHELRFTRWYMMHSGLSNTVSSTVVYNWLMDNREQLLTLLESKNES